MRKGLHARKRAAPALVLICGLAATSCVSSHRVLPASHAGHNRAVQTRIDEELLLNLVRLRYRDSPLFLRIGSVVVQFELSAGASAGVTLEEGAGDSVDIGASLGASEQPTFTFTPMQDEEFVRRLLRPIDLDVTMLLQRSGWSIERVMRITVRSMNGLDNAASASGPTPARAPGYERFRRAARALRALQVDGLVALGYVEEQVELAAPVPAGSVAGADLVAAAKEGYRFRKAGDGELVLTGSEQRPVMLLSSRAVERAEARELVELLGLAPGRSRYGLVTATTALEDALAPRGEREQVLLELRSLLGALFYVSQAIEVPKPHVERGLVTVTRDAQGQPFDWDEVSGDLLRVRSAPSRPEHAAVAVPHRGHWFYIDDADLSSKSTFTLLVELFSLQASDAGGEGPVLTLPVGG